MRLSKGSSLKGLCGLKPIRNMYGITLIRPFLALPREVLHTALQEQEYVQDPSNNNTQFERVRLRQWLSHVDIMDGFLRSYQKLEQVNDMMMSMAKTFAVKHIRGQDVDLQPLLDLDFCFFTYVIKTFVLDDFVDDDSILRLRQNLLEQTVMTLGHKKFIVLDKRMLRIEHVI